MVEGMSYTKKCKVCGGEGIHGATRTTATKNSRWGKLRGYWCNKNGMSWYKDDE